MSPRPILKRTLTERSHPTAVHFAPSHSTCIAYPASAYDRSPIVVTPNSCALPAHGCPGRTYFDEHAARTDREPRRIHHASDYHPRALAFASSSQRRETPTLPSLVPDLSSESEESDGFYGPPSASAVTFGPHGLATSPAIHTTTGRTMHTHAYAPCDESASLSFLPYSPASPAAFDHDDSDPAHKDKHRRRRGERERKHDTSRSPDRIRNQDVQTSQFASAFSSLSISPPSPSSPTKKRSSSRKRPSSFAPSAFSSPDDGCLGGF